MFGWLRRKHPGSSLPSLLFYEVCRNITQILLMAILGLRWRGTANMPRSGGVLVVANHQSYLDPPVIGAVMGTRQFDFLARAGLFDIPFLRRLITLLYAVPVKEAGGDPASIKAILRRLEQGRVVLIFPEGTRTWDGSVGEFKRGVALILRKSRCPVLPVGLAGAFEAWPRGSGPRLGRGRVVVQVGQPISHEDLLADGVDAALKRLRAEVDALRERAEELRR
ncbi:MAG: 1-acyl-sn-glycerol-3-phosphate acyltransferase [Phycisphaerales bacterium]|nr:1-acyl-sn-glycerol-3-phosphate acyltransferase [Planctomycetota bacterium]MCH8507253.1 1-acyl-sn-glycerol-3-phosphate acyltransferase [Phycisphaerales bacterium]